MKTEDRIWYLDVLRIVSIFFVIVIHVNGHITDEANNMTASFFSNTSRFCVPVFVMISGAIYIISLFATCCLKKIPLVNKYLV